MRPITTRGSRASSTARAGSALDVTGPNGIVLTLEGRGAFGTLGVTELFFETVEPENADVPIVDVLATLPPGNYRYMVSTSLSYPLHLVSEAAMTAD